MSAMNRLKPVYVGAGIEVRPKRWWSPSGRRNARLTAALLEHAAPFEPGAIFPFPGNVRIAWTIATRWITEQEAREMYGDSSDCSDRCRECRKPITLREATQGDTCAECLFG